MTLTDAINATHRQEFFHVTVQNRDGLPVRCRVNGKCKTWKTRPGQFKLPVKYGLRDCFYITEKNAHEWSAVHAYDPIRAADKLNKATT